MAFTLRTTDDDEKVIENAQKYVNSNKKGEILLECARLVPTLKGDIQTLEKEVYRLQQVERRLEDIQRMFKSLIA